MLTKIYPEYASAIQYRYIYIEDGLNYKSDYFKI